MKRNLTYLIVFFILTVNSFSEVIYVNRAATGLNNGTSWTDAFTSLQTALDYSVMGSEIWVAQGTYKPSMRTGGNTDRHKSFLMKLGVSLYGGFAGTETDISQRNWENNLTILSGDIGNIDDKADNCYHIVTYPSGEIFDMNTVFDGFVVKYGNSDSENPDNRGAALVLNQNGSPLIQNCTFEYNTTSYRGGAIYNAESSPQFINCNFNNNSSSIDGGAIYNYYANNSSLSNCKLKFNQSGSGGAIYNYYSDNFIIENSDLSYNNTTMMNNFPLGGGGIFNYYGSFHLSSCEIYNNTTAEIGGGILNHFGNFSVSNSQFHNNSSRDGGGIFTQDGTFNAIYCEIYDNTSGDGGGINIKSNGTMANCKIFNNTATNYGGGVYFFAAYDPLNFSMTNTEINNNSSRYGGGILGYDNFASFRLRINISNSKIYNNISSNSGGGIGTFWGEINLTNCEIFNNSTIDLGGGIYSRIGQISITNCTITKNIAATGGGIYSSTSNIKNSIIFGNTASKEANELYKESGSVILDYSCYSNGNGDIFGQITANNCINTNPLFVDPNGNDFRVYGVSPCIDAGNDTYINEPFDVRGEGYPRKLNGENASEVGTVDIGAYEFKFGEDQFNPPDLIAPILIQPANNDENISTVATFEWSKVDNATGYRIQISNSNSFGIKYVNQVETETSVVLTDLVPHMKLYWRVAALNPTSSLWSETWSFTTNNVALPIVATNDVTNITQNSAACGGNVTSAEDRPVTARGVCWNTSSNPTIDNNKTSDGTGTGSFASNMTGLEPNTTYYVRAYAINRDGVAYGNEVVFTSKGIPIVITQDAQNITSGSADLGGEISKDGGSTITKKGVCWSETNTNPTVNDSFIDVSEDIYSFFINAANLKAGTKYYFRAYGFNEYGEGYGDSKSFTTLQKYIPVVKTIGADNITTNSADLKGQIIDQGGSTLTSKGICWSKTNTNPTVNDEHEDVIGNSDLFTVNLSGIPSGTTYYFRAYGINSFGVGYGESVSFQTLSNQVNFYKMSFQGILSDNNGIILPNGQYNLTMTIFDSETGGSSLWTEVHTVSLKNGLFNTVLGETNPLNLPFNTSYFLEISINNGDVLSPRTPIVGPFYMGGWNGK